MCVIGVIIFVFASTHVRSDARGIGHGRMDRRASASSRVWAARCIYPSALAIVVNTFPLRERGHALALFFGIAGGLTAVGPILGRVPDPVDVARHLLGEHPGGAHRVGPHRGVQTQDRVQAALPLDYRGAVLIAVGIGLSIFGLQQSGLCGAGATPGPGSASSSAWPLSASSSSSSSGRRLPSFRSRSSASAPSRSRVSCC